MAACLCAAAFSALPAAAEQTHHIRHTAHHYVHTAHHYVHHNAPSAAAALETQDTGYGPTAPGVSAILVDAQTGQVLGGNGADTPRYPASLTKLMTLDLAFQALRSGQMTLDTQIPVSYHATSVEPVKLGLVPGSTIAVRDAILAMTTMSANDAATALGEYLGGGSEARCAQMMTARAQALGMTQTHFANASGLPNPTQVTTAHDLALLARDIVTNFPEDQQFFEVQSFNFHGRTVYSNNQMLKTYPGATGMKTGYTDLARHNLVTSAERNGRVLIGVVLHEPSWGATYAQMRTLLDTGFYGHVPATTVAAAQPVAPQGGTLQLADTSHARAPAPIPAASRAHPQALGGWVAQVGVYSYMARARVAALDAHKLRGQGVPRIAKVEAKGRTLWSAQLAGLTSTSARTTCHDIKERGGDCLVISPSADHLAMLTNNDGA
ncbi:D-alanyl-D-alanine carboxypeptidase family protein [Acidocella sp. KAb 2-4]|uniref:D-alanyl-D-alanine carboxypeptidase family protein n=1 Tax=Acidocella sp. KAb 2-4 TaxID=2885158 RepID=UPI001D084D9A|nr:D-alanyl-D-alanine carboxypeptidase family protein [Acidocella sp. KAb 2-4]MCB5943689.1 D-alanyl-D-alanine carboxypeptidase [Acidocella sp. KAb 2-4]